MTRRFSTSVSMMFREFDLPERFAQAKAAGFEGVEIQFLAEGKAADMAAAATAAEIAVTLINVDMGDYMAGGSGLSGVPGCEALFHSKLANALDAAEALDARFVHLGPSRVPAGVDRAACLDTYRRNIDHALESAARRQCATQLVIEPMNRVDAPEALINDIDDGAALIRADYAGAVGLQFDIYHVAMNGHDPVEAYARHHDIAAHVQFSDSPGRQPPGDGTLDFAAIFSGIEGHGYDGLFGAEYMPRQPTLETLGWMQQLARRG
jgi:hydroxypyruvate isomerase